MLFPDLATVNNIRVVFLPSPFDPIEPTHSSHGQDHVPVLPAHVEVHLEVMENVIRDAPDDFSNPIEAAVLMQDSLQVNRLAWSIQSLPLSFFPVHDDTNQ